MTEANHLNLDRKRLLATSYEHARRAARELDSLVNDEWPADGTTEIEARVIALDGKLVETAVYVRRYLDLNDAGKPATSSTSTNRDSPHVVSFSETTPEFDLRLVANKIIHHKLMHAESPDSVKITTITSECDNGYFTKFDIVDFCNAVATALGNGQKS
ncbi:hypothetical protein FQV27_11940 [Paracoccus aurantiacus]|uniref:Uncharacterized protein n=1 Tax=Paracoccus aurantiacus TaxID=2599412 RepID=A0A5C6S2J7_9RHOB|nr:hypothetical protein [Paracoccus aurantiacus]TXB68688.1 hypothetical protein FQV27_11940 [Paracoccus aurantiacus]